MKLFVLLFTLSFFHSSYAQVVVNDVTQLNPVVVEKVVTPTSIEEIQKVMTESTGRVSIGGGRYSMGGQTAIENSVQIDMRTFNKVVQLDIENKKITVQAGIRWRDLQEVIDPVNLSVKIMQTYSNFTVGGSLSVNVHGRYVGQGPLIRSVESIRVVLADGSLVNASPLQNSEIFYASIGGYGGIGVIVEATLQLADNEKVERKVELIKASDYARYFKENIRDHSEVLFHNGDIYPPRFESVRAVSWVKTDKPLTVEERLIPRNQKHPFAPRAISLLNQLPFGRQVRATLIDPFIYRKPMVVWRNYEASYDVAELEPPSREKSTFVLQEYFVPVAKFDEFVPKMRDIFNQHQVKVFNVSIRHALPDTGSMLAWAPEEVFAFVVYYQQGTTPKDRDQVGVWTRKMVDAALSVGGRYYLPYQLHPTVEQFRKAYPRYQEYFDLKTRLDPNSRFTNKLWEHYLQ